MLQNRNAAADEARGVPELTQLGGTGIRGNSLSVKKGQAIIAELIGSNVCTAVGITVVDRAPLLALCRALVTAGHDPNRPLHAYRGDLCLCVRSIDEGARLAIEDERHGRPRLRRWRNRAPQRTANSLTSIMRMNRGDKSTLRVIAVNESKTDSARRHFWHSTIT